MNFIERVVETVKDTFYDLVEALSNRMQVWHIRLTITREKRKYIGLLTESEIQYEPEAPDIELALRVAAYLRQKFPDGIQARLQDLTVEERKELICQIVEDAEKLFEVPPVNFEISYPTSSEDFLASCCGFYNRQHNLLSLNGALLMSEDVKWVEEQIYTIFHEMKHVRQYVAIEGLIDYDYSEELLRAWRYNSIVYIRPHESDESYRKQAMENDAFGIEDYIRKLMTKENEFNESN